MAKEPPSFAPSVLSLPSGPGKILGLGGTFQPSLSTGTSSQSIDLTVPRGRNGLSPKLSIQYNSGYGNSELGMGYRLFLPHIRRQTNDGLPNYVNPWGESEYAVDTFVDQDASELVYVGNNNFKSDSSRVNVLYSKIDVGWKAKFSDGLIYTYGKGNSVLKKFGKEAVWYVSQISDHHGNTIDFKYSIGSDGITPLLEHITYGSHDSNLIKVSIEYEDRPDWIVDYKFGYKTYLDKRLDRISISVAGKNISYFNIDYSDGDSLQSKLTKVEITDASNGSILNSTEYTYTQSEFDSAQSIEAINKFPVNFEYLDTQFLDVNKDAIPDIIETLHNRDIVHVSQFSTDSTWAEGVEMASSNTGKISDPGVTWADINGDGKTDLVVSNGSGLVFHSINDESYRWEELSKIDRIQIGLDAVGTAMVDVNHDKRIDIINLSGNGKVSYQLNTETGFSNATINSLPGNFCLCNDYSMLADMNGDGLQDLVYAVSNYIYFYPSMGVSGYDSKEVFTNPPQIGSSGKFQLFDMNSDGLSDLVQLSNYWVKVWMNRGVSTNGEYKFDSEIIIEKPDEAGNVTRVEIVDLNGNGSKDILWFSPRQGSKTFVYTELYPNEQPNQLKTITNGIGGKTTLHYTSIVDEMIRDREAGNPWDHGVPVAMQVVKKIEVEDGISGTKQVTTFDYHNGYYHAEEKEFRGFESSVETVEGDTNQRSLITSNEYHLGKDYEVLKGLPKKVEVKDATGNVFTSEENTWNAKKVADGAEGEDRDVYFAELKSVERIIKEKGAGSEVTLNWAYEYDNYGNTTKITEYGRSGTGWNDERVTENTFSASNATSLGNWMLAYPTQTLIKDGVDNIISKEQWFYDDENFGGSNFGEVTKGNLTLHRKWVDPSDNSNYVNLVRNKYDTYGNVTDIYGPLWQSGNTGHHTQIEYDSVFNTYPVKETVYTGGETLVAHATYNYDYGTMSTFTDFNSQKTSFFYDEFGRLEKVVKPGDSENLPTTSYGYVLNHSVTGGTVNYVETQQREESGESGVITSRSYYDGLGRMLHQVSEGSSAGHFVVSGYTAYSKRGLPQYTYQPFASTSLDFTNTVDDSVGYVETLYDELGRVVKTFTPSDDNNSRSFSTIAYEPLIQKIYDNEQTNASSDHYGSYKQLTFDGLLNDKGQGRLVQVDEVVALTIDGKKTGTATVWSTQYEYDVLGNFTKLTDAQSNERVMMYDGLSRNYFYNDPNRGYFWTAFDAASNILATRDANGNEVHNIYDGANRLLNEYHITPTTTNAKVDQAWVPSFDAQGLTPVTTFTYDKIGLSSSGYSLGRLVKVEDQAGYSQYKFDNRGRVSEQSRQITGHGIHSALYTSKRQYDTMDRLTRYDYADGTYLTYGYDDRGLLNNLSGVISNVVYDVAGNQTLREYTNGVDIHYTYDHQLRLETLRAEREVDSENLQNYTYEFDELTNIKSITDNRSDSTLVTIANEISLDSQQASDLKQSFTYKYDDLYRLAEASSTLSNLATYQYRYDMIGNLQARTTATANGTSISKLRYGNSQSDDNAASSDRSGRMFNEAPGPHALTSFNGNDRYWYDNNGNLTQDGDLYYQWDHKNRLIQVSTQAPANP